MLNRLSLSLVVMLTAFLLTAAPLFAQGVPKGGSRPLTSVTHDGTLTGEGTSTSPLSVVSPYTGVVHDGTLAGAGTAASPLRVVPSSSIAAPLSVVDSTGTTVGRFGYPSFAYMRINNLFFAAPVARRDNIFADGLDFSQQPIYYDTTDCTGSAYIAVNGGVTPEVVRSSVVAMVGGLGGQTVAFIGDGNPSTRNSNSRLVWGGTSYVCVSSVQTQTLSHVTDTLDVTGMFTAPLVIQ
jgi:hypothetical protein